MRGCLIIDQLLRPLTNIHLGVHELLQGLWLVGESGEPDMPLAQISS